MIGRMFRLLGLAAGLAIALPALSQVGHPAKGSWSGYWGTSKDDQHRMLLVMDWKNDEIVGTINPGRNSAKIEHAKLDYSTWTLTIEAELPFHGGAPAHFVATGKLENLGSWTNRRYSGTYRHGNEQGTFMVTLN